MPAHTSPAVTFMLKFTAPRASFVDYTNRDKAVENDIEQPVNAAITPDEGLSDEIVDEIRKTFPETDMDFGRYIDYMNRAYATENYNQEQVTPLFNQEYYHAPTSVITDLKNKLDLAYDNGSVMWQGVVSFDNKFLAAQGLYNEETQTVDQQAVKSAIRDMMPGILKNEGLSQSAFWWGDIHLNTDNVHVHIGISEVNSAREFVNVSTSTQPERKGAFSQKTIRQAKSMVYHHLLDERTRERMKRKEVQIANARHELFDDLNHELSHEARSNQRENQQRFYLNQIQSHLPEHGNLRYGSNAKEFKVAKFYLDKYISSYLEGEGETQYKNFKVQSTAFLSEFNNAFTASDQPLEKRELNNGDLKRNAASQLDQHLQKAMTGRDQELRERLANRVLKYLKDNQLIPEPNFKTFSKGNRERIASQMPSAVEIRSAGYWQSLGRAPAKDEIPVMLYQPNGETKNGRKLFEQKPFYELAQTEPIEMHRTNRISIQNLLLLSSDDLANLIETGKKAQLDQSNGGRVELGQYRYAYHQRLLHEQGDLLVAQAKVIQLIEPLATDQPFVSLQKTENLEQQNLVKLQLMPKKKVTPEQKQLLDGLALKYQDPVQFKIKDASEEKVQVPIERLMKNMELANKVRNEDVFSMLYGEGFDKGQYLEQASAKVSILTIKNEIFERDLNRMASEDVAVQHELARQNGQAFNQLKQLYAKVQGKELPEPNDSNPKRELAVDPKVQKIVHKAQQRQLQNTKRQTRSVRSASSYATALGRALKAGNQSELRAMKAREREEERDEDDPEQSRGISR